MGNPVNQYSPVIDSPLGKLGIQVLGQQLHRLDYLAGSVRLRSPGSTFERKIVQQLEGYFENPDMNFSVSFGLTGTPFQQRVWLALTEITPGETITYGELAASLGSGARAVGNACRHNPIPIIVPCHRVVAANGIGGYSGNTHGPVLDHKYWLLQHESQIKPALQKPA